MENATKALLFAGGVLVVIILIALGIQMVNSTKPTTDQIQSTLSAQEIQTYNAQFIQYEGIQKGSKVKDLIRQIQLNNYKNMDVGNTIEIYCLGVFIDFDDSSEQYYQNGINRINITKSYSVSMRINEKTGYVAEVYITEPT